MPNPLLMAVSRSTRTRRLITAAPVTRRVVDRFVAGEQVDDALAATRRLVGEGLHVSLDHLGEDTRTTAQADAITAAYRTVLGRLGDTGLADRAEVSLKLSALGQLLPDGDRIALEAARVVCAAAAAVGTTVSVDMEDSSTVDATLTAVAALRADFPWVGAVLQSCLRRTEADCRDLSGPGSRIRLVKGAYAEPASVAFTDKAEVDAAYARCLQVLVAGQGYPMVATHDPALITRTEELVAQTGRAASSYEFQMLYGIRVPEQHRLAASGRTMRIYVPYGDDWYGYFMRRLAERPANVAFFLRSFVSR
ncbi:MAG: proline dehydrogenase family protein [Frankiaceae bacterium]|nr:proline dehydrogenase family protein [Frankiaceae bacterium]